MDQLQLDRIDNVNQLQLDANELQFRLTRLLLDANQLQLKLTRMQQGTIQLQQELSQLQLWGWVHSLYKMHPCTLYIYIYIYMYACIY